MTTSPQHQITRTRRLARLVALLELSSEEAMVFREESLPVVGTVEMRTIESVLGKINEQLERVRIIEHNERVRARASEVVDNESGSPV